MKRGFWLFSTKPFHFKISQFATLKSQMNWQIQGHNKLGPIKKMHPKGLTKQPPFLLERVKA